MNLSWLDDFLALAASGNFSRAAEERHMTQPAFSRRIRALEEWLGVVLFDRTTHPVTLTETGEWFCSVAQDTLGRVARIPEEARAVSDASSATLRFASTHALSFTFLPTWLRSLESHTTVGPVQLVSDVLQQCEAMMLQGRVHFLLCHWHEQVPGRLDPATFRSLRVGSDRLVPVAAADDAGRPRHRLSAGGNERVPILAYSAESGIGRIVRTLRGAVLEKANTELVFTAHLASVLKTMVLGGRGVAWLPISLIGDELKSGRLVEEEGPEWRIDVDSDEQLRAILHRALRSPHQLALHVVGDAQTDRLLTLMQELATPETWKSKRVRIEHGDGIRPDTLARVAQLGLVVVQNPTHFPPPSMARSRPHSMLASLARGGVALALGSDGGPEEMNPFLNIMLASTYAAAPDEALTREQALLAYTAGGAHAQRTERTTGRLAVGYAADVAVLSQNVLEVAGKALPATHSVLTLVDGEIVYEDTGLAGGAVQVDRPPALSSSPLK